MLRYSLLALCLIAVSGCGGEPARQGPPPQTALLDVACPGIQCVTRQNAQRTVTTLELAAMFRGYRGHDMVLRVDDALSRRTMIRESSPTLEDGRYAIGIAADRLPPGRYDFVIVPEESRGLVLAAGRFTIQRGSAVTLLQPSSSPTAARPTAARPIAARPTAAPPPAAQPTNASQIAAMQALVGTWRGIDGVVGVLNLRADGTYVYNDRASGHYKFYGSEIVFDGALAAWNGGRATLRDAYLDFYWTSLDGAPQWYSFAKGS
jgi:hypothetical protein